MQTFPTFIYISASRGVPAEANVIASAVFIITIALVVVSQVVSRARAKALKRNA
jgi:spermidine/putrescine transport system permease protein